MGKHWQSAPLPPAAGRTVVSTGNRGFRASKLRDGWKLPAEVTPGSTYPRAVPPAPGHTLQTNEVVSLPIFFLTRNRCAVPDPRGPAGVLRVPCPSRSPSAFRLLVWPVPGRSPRPPELLPANISNPYHGQGEGGNPRSMYSRTPAESLKFRGCNPSDRPVRSRPERFWSVIFRAGWLKMPRTGD